jgi:hypothetical protein
MTVFTIHGDATRYKHPDGPADVTLGQYIAFLTDIMPLEPPQVRQAQEQGIKAHEALESLQTWIEKVVPNPTATLTDDKIKMLKAYATDSHSPKKARQVLPELVAALEGAHTRQMQAVDAMGGVWYAKEMIPYMARVVSHFTGIHYDTIMKGGGHGMAVRTIEYLYGKIVKSCHPPTEYTYQRTYIFEGETYELPARHMTNATVIEFAEAAQFQANVEKVQNGNLLCLVDVIAVLLRKPGEQYSDEVYERNRANFQRLPLSTAMDIAFFLMRQSQQSALNFVTSTTIPMGERGLREVAQTLRKDTAGISHSRPLPKVVYSIGPTARR